MTEMIDNMQEVFCTSLPFYKMRGYHYNDILRWYSHPLIASNTGQISHWEPFPIP